MSGLAVLVVGVLLFPLLAFLVFGFILGGQFSMAASALGECGPIAQPSGGAIAAGMGTADGGDDPTLPLASDGLSPVRIAELAMAVGFTGEEVPMAVAIALAESRGRPGIDNAGLNKDGSVDYGLWQINDDAHGPKGFDPAQARDPVYNAVWARRVYTDAGSSWSPWMVYRRDMYQQHLAVATAAAGIASPRPEDQAAAAAVGTGGSESPQAATAGCMGATQLINSGFPAEIEPYQPRDPQRTCDPAAKPGVVDFKNLLLAAYPKVSWGIDRDCSASPSEHVEGRALDWGVNVNNPEQRAAAEDVIAKLLATDEHGNTHALFRRLGLMYIIWNRQIISSSRISEGWRPYSCDGTPGDCHTNHIHFSFSWAGARRETSWWTVGTSAQPLGPQAPPDEAGDARAAALAPNQRR